MRDRITLEGLARVTCPACGSEPGVGCVSKGGAPVQGIHISRWNKSRADLFHLVTGRSGTYYKRNEPTT